MSNRSIVVAWIASLLAAGCESSPTVRDDGEAVDVGDGQGGTTEVVAEAGRLEDETDPDPDALSPDIGPPAEVEGWTVIPVSAAVRGEPACVGPERDIVYAVRHPTRADECNDGAWLVRHAEVRRLRRSEGVVSLVAAEACTPVEGVWFQGSPYFHPTGEDHLAIATTCNSIDPDLTALYRQVSYSIFDLAVDVLSASVVLEDVPYGETLATWNGHACAKVAPGGSSRLECRSLETPHEVALDVEGAIGFEVSPDRTWAVTDRRPTPTANRELYIVASPSGPLVATGLKVYYALGAFSPSSDRFLTLEPVAGEKNRVVGVSADGALEEVVGPFGFGSFTGGGSANWSLFFGFSPSGLFHSHVAAKDGTVAEVRDLTSKEVVLTWPGTLWVAGLWTLDDLGTPERSAEGLILQEGDPEEGPCTAPLRVWEPGDVAPRLVTERGLRLPGWPPGTVKGRHLFVEVPPQDADLPEEEFGCFTETSEVLDFDLDTNTSAVVFSDAGLPGTLVRGLAADQAWGWMWTWNGESPGAGWPEGSHPYVGDIHAFDPSMKPWSPGPLLLEGASRDTVECGPCFLATVPDVPGSVDGTLYEICPPM